MFSDGLYMTKPPLWSNMIEFILAQTPKMKPNELIQALTPWGQATGAPGQLLPKRLPVGCLLKPMRRRSFALCGWYQMTHSLICWAIRICLFGSNLFWVSTSVWHNLGPWATDAVPFRSSTLHKSSMAHRIALHRISREPKVRRWITVLTAEELAPSNPAWVRCKTVSALYGWLDFGHWDYWVNSEKNSPFQCGRKKGSPNHQNPAA